jgi:hypothetical protein
LLFVELFPFYFCHNLLIKLGYNSCSGAAMD